MYQAWERYNDLLYRCPTHDLNNQQKVNLFYKGINIATRQMIDFQGPIPGMTPARALDVIQDMADHSQKWHDGGSTRSTGEGLEGMNALTNQLENLGREMKKLKESVHAIQVGCDICEGAHLAKDCPLSKNDKRSRKSNMGMEDLFRVMVTDIEWEHKDLIPDSTTGQPMVRGDPLSKKPSANSWKNRLKEKPKENFG